MRGIARVARESSTAFLWLVAIFLLSSCATTHPINTTHTANTYHFQKLAKIQSFQLKGRIGIQMPGQGYSGSFKWQHLAQNTDEISFFSPVGSQVAKITQSPTIATLTDNKGNTYKAANASALIDEHLGWQIPVNDLNDWLLARAQADNDTNITVDTQGRLITLDKKDWSIQYANYRAWDQTDLPGKITLKKPNFSLKLIIQDWQVSP